MPWSATRCGCGAPVTPLLGLEHSADVDHFFPHSLMARGVLDEAKVRNELIPALKTGGYRAVAVFALI